MAASLRRITSAVSPASATRRCFSTSPARQAVWGFIGLGRMGYPMAKNLRAKLPKEDTLVIHDINTAALSKFKQESGPQSVHVAENVREVAEKSETIITALPEPHHVRGVYANMLIPPTLLDAAGTKPRLFIDVSTIDPQSSLEVANAVHSSGQGKYVDAPMSGGVVGAEKGTLTFMVGAPDEIIDRVREILSLMGKRTVHLGPASSGLKGKLANNYLLAINNIATAEAMNLGIQWGLEPKALADLINTATGKCWPSEVNNPVPGVVEGSPASKGYAGGFGLSLMNKDLKLALKGADEYNIKLGLGEPAREIYDAASEHPECKGKDFSVVYRAMPELLDFILAHEDAFKSRGRLASLYSDFRIQQATNPDGYNANISAWRQALVDASRAGLVPSQTGTNNLLTLGTGEVLLRELTSKDFGRPLALAAVIHDAVTKKEMIPLKDFQAAKTSIYSRSWSISPLSILSWGLQQLGVIGGTTSQDKLATDELVVMPNLEAASNAIIAQASTPKSAVDLIYSLDSFRTTFAHAVSPTHALTPTDTSVLLTHLSRDKSALSYDPASQTIRFAPANSNAPPAPITQQDITIAHLRSLIASLNAQLPVLSARIASCDAAARAAVSTKTRTAALAALRSKKLAEQGLARRADTLAQLEQVYAKIEEAADNVEVVRAMEASTGVLRGLHEQVGGAEGVEEVVERLREEMGKADEVNEIVNEVGREGAVVDEDEVDEEFAALERAEKEKAEREEAEKTAQRLREVERMEEERKRVEKAREAESRRAEEAAKEKGITASQAEEAQVLETSQELGRMSLDEESRPTEASKEQVPEKRQLVPAE
ncbi:3-hydroxyisobutyrate dehydrogenase [Neofusicoccum parvum]|uniref:3-hydroxyisobutyrate dehydrogenase n=1 Tax=Neofusicoccum parvum TaxID=310453 RepID=A0ACB5RVF9_9PEZI|nr:3-hydroxyisobutyrate dehydrogenase [Neofusicoccum parvum]